MMPPELLLKLVELLIVPELSKVPPELLLNLLWELVMVKVPLLVMMPELLMMPPAFRLMVPSLMMVPKLSISEKVPTVKVTPELMVKVTPELTVHISKPPTAVFEVNEQVLGDVLQTASGMLSHVDWSEIVTASTS